MSNYIDTKYEVTLVNREKDWEASALVDLENILTTHHRHKNKYMFRVEGYTGSTLDVNTSGVMRFYRGNRYSIKVQSQAGYPFYFTKQGGNSAFPVGEDKHYLNYGDNNKKVFGEFDNEKGMINGEITFYVDPEIFKDVSTFYFKAYNQPGTQGFCKIIHTFKEVFDITSDVNNIYTRAMVNGTKIPDIKCDICKKSVPFVNGMFCNCSICTHTHPDNKKKYCSHDCGTLDENHIIYSKLCNANFKNPFSYKGKTPNVCNKISKIMDEKPDALGTQIHEISFFKNHVFTMISIHGYKFVIQKKETKINNGVELEYDLKLHLDGKQISIMSKKDGVTPASLKEEYFMNKETLPKTDLTGGWSKKTPGGGMKFFSIELIKTSFRSTIVDSDNNGSNGKGTSENNEDVQNLHTGDNFKKVLFTFNFKVNIINMGKNQSFS